MADLGLRVLKGEFSIHRLDAGEPIPRAVLQSDVFWIGKTHEELSIVCRSNVRLAGSKVDAGWSCIKVIGPLDLNMTGVLASLCGVLAKAAISVFALSTYDTDYILTKSCRLDQAIDVLVDAGYAVDWRPGDRDEQGL